MHPSLRLLLCFFALQIVVFGQSPVWKISKNEQTLYVGGTCHILRQSDFPLPEAFDAAYNESDLLVFEVDPARMQDPAVATQLMRKARYTDGRTLKTVLSKEVYDELAAQAKKSEMPIEVLNGLKPGMAVMMLTIQELMKAGVTQDGVDMVFAKRAKADGKPVRSLETAEFQIDLITSMGEGLEDELVRYSLRDLNQIEKFFGVMIRAWREGDNQALERLFVDDMRKFPGLYEALLAERNENWMNDLEKMLATPEVEFVLVGAGHLVGEDGLLASFQKMGCQVQVLGSESVQ
ncbi:TraB/GumN family protein [Coraliomargarita sinensis]|nr:TraB/GumN family protein [Coraliomargarita sinensis]